MEQESSLRQQATARKPPFSMTLSVRHKSNIRHFVYYLINGTLDFELIQATFGDNYYKTLQDTPDYFYKTACVFINQEVVLNPSWLATKKLGRFICHLHNPNISISDFEDWEFNLAVDKADFSSDFKNFTQWFLRAETVDNISYKNYIEDGASFVEQCFAIWANVVTLDNNKVTNQDHAISRVKQWIISYYTADYKSDLKDWECELHFE